MPKTRAAASPTVKKSKKMKSQPTQEQIALRAYQIYLERNGAPGNPFEDWVRAERELTEQAKKATRKSKVVSIAA
jgi:hypothetical protein